MDTLLWGFLGLALGVVVIVGVFRVGINMMSVDREHSAAAANALGAMEQFFAPASANAHIERQLQQELPIEQLDDEPEVPGIELPHDAAAEPDELAQRDEPGQDEATDRP